MSPPAPRAADAPARGRPRIELPPKALQLMDSLGQIRCTIEEIAAALTAAGWPVSKNTLKRHYGTHIKELREAGRSSLRRAQWTAALKGNATMLIWLGKQELGQADRHELTGKDGGPIRTVAKQVMVIGDRRITF